jgi:hypothetical protein
MAMELIRFLTGSLILLIPGVLLARRFSLGHNSLERCANGCSLGLAMAVFLASAASYFDLRWFYPLWACAGALSVALWIKSFSHPARRGDSAVQILMLVVLVLVGVIRFALALPLELPLGSFDPTFHLILAKKIQITQHAISNWSPFAKVKLDYPTGSHVLIVVLAEFCGLPLHTTFKDLIPLLGVLTTAQMYAFARRATNNPSIALYSAAVYGLWAWCGSNDYFRWGGLPNELAMLLFITMLTLWLDHPGRSGQATMAVLFAGTILVHHHVMVVSAVILLLLILWEMSAGGMRWKSLAIPAAAALLLDAFFLAPYALRLGSLSATGIVAGGEYVLPLADLPRQFGYALTCVALAGIVLCLIRKYRCPPIIAIPSLALAVMFVVGEDVVPLTLRALHKTPFTFFTPSRFLGDLNYFLPIFAGVAIWYFRQRLHVALWITMLLILLAPLGDWSQWNFMIGLITGQPQLKKEGVVMARVAVLPASFVRACDWIQHHTPPDTIVDNSEDWTTYLCWRKADNLPLPISEPSENFHPESERIPLILSGKIPPDKPGMMIVAIRDPGSYHGEPILWEDPSGQIVIREWPR